MYLPITNTLFPKHIFQHTLTHITPLLYPLNTHPYHLTSPSPSSSHITPITPFPLIPSSSLSQVARRLWSKGGTLYHRIRLLPSPLSDYRLLQLMRLADVVLDTFPVGSPLHTHALALSVGTPVLTMKRLVASNQKDNDSTFSYPLSNIPSSHPPSLPFPPFYVDHEKVVSYG